MPKSYETNDVLYHSQNRYGPRPTVAYLVHVQYCVFKITYLIPWSLKSAQLFVHYVAYLIN